MPFTSTQVSGLVGGQQVMFANQATFANQIGGGSGAMMANPYPSPSYGVAGLDPGSPDIGHQAGWRDSLLLAHHCRYRGFNSRHGWVQQLSGATRPVYWSESSLWSRHRFCGG
jgi:hypothetical protein